jgi:hypothetical protein
VVWDRGVREGEYFSEADVRSSARVALLGHKAADQLFDGEDPIGKQIQIGGAPFRVKGILEHHGFDPHGFDRDDEVHVPISTMMRRVVNVDTIGAAKLLIERPDQVDETADEIADLLYARHGLADGEPEDFSIYTPTQVQQAVKEANRVLTVYLPATAGIALLVAAIVIANIMLIGVRERIGEIGLRKAVGATDRQIGGQFLLESVAVRAVLTGKRGRDLAFRWPGRGRGRRHLDRGGAHDQPRDPSRPRLDRAGVGCSPGRRRAGRLPARAAGGPAAARGRAALKRGSGPGRKARHEVATQPSAFAKGDHPLVAAHPAGRQRGGHRHRLGGGADRCRSRGRSGSAPGAGAARPQPASGQRRPR